MEDNWKPIPESEQFDKTPLVKKHKGNVEINLSDSKKYDKQSRTMMKEARDIQKPRINKLRTSIKEGFLYTNKTDDENTHPHNKSCTPNSKHTMTKDINDHDRLGYEIYPPVETDADPLKPVSIKVKLINRSGHL